MAELTPALLEARDLAVECQGKRLLSRLSFVETGGKMVAVLGPNGAGKSTLLKALAGLLPSQGQVCLAGHSIASLDRCQRARTVAYVPQHSALDAALPVRDVVGHGRFAHRDPWGRASAADDAAIDKALQLTDTERLSQRIFCHLSYGERRLVLLARALCTEARILLLDEPTAALDVGHVLRLMHVLEERARAGCLVLVALHQLNEAAQFCERALLLANGRLVTEGPVTEVLAQDPVRQVYGVDLVAGACFGYSLSRGKTRGSST